MIELSVDLLKAALAEARLAPSVHNVQPSRWRLAGDRLLLLGDPARAIPVADPAGRDWRLSHGAHFEGLALAFAARGARLVDVAMQDAPPGRTGSCPIADVHGARGCRAAPQRAGATTRMSWRGAFKPADDATRADLARLATERRRLHRS